MAHRKQPYRNALKKLKKERDVLKHQLSDVASVRSSLLKKQSDLTFEHHSVTCIKNEVLKELKFYNPYHPYLDVTKVISKHLNLEAALDYRIAAPVVTDEPYNNTARITLYFKTPNQGKQIGVLYFSREALFGSNELRSYIDDENIKWISEHLARQLYDYFRKQK